MFKNYVVDALRNIKKHKGYSFINIFGLTIGIACFVLFFMWVQDELSFDRFHENRDEIFRVITKTQIAEKEIHNVRTPNALGAALKNDFPEIINFTRTQGFDSWVLQYGEKKFNNDMVAVADYSFFEMFTFPFIKGDPKTAFNEDTSMVITESFARKYFGDEDPINKIITIPPKGFKVTGVIKNNSLNSHIRFDCIFPINNMRDFWETNLESWEGSSPFYTYVQLRKNVSWQEVNKKISNIIKKYLPEAKTEIYLQPLKDVHLKSKFEGDLDNYKQGNINYIYIISLIALGILFIACFNYMNLSTARSTDRTKGIAMRKVLGASRGDIIKQFLGEAIVLSFIALILAVILIYILLPIFNNLSDKHLTITILGRLPFLLGLIVLTVIIGIISGSYPAIFLSSFQPVNILKGTGTTPIKGGRKALLRKALVVAQFAIAIVLIFSTTVIYTQLKLLKTKELGFNPHNVFTFFSAHQIEYGFEEKKALFMSNPNVQNFAMGPAPIFLTEKETENVDWEGKNPDEKIVMFPMHINYEYIELWQLKIVAGRSFSKEFATDTSAFILNETAVKATGLKSPLGKRFRLNDQQGVIIGVVKDFHHKSLHSPIMPVVLMLNYEQGRVSVRLNPNNIPETLRFLESTWDKINQGPYPFTGNFVDEAIANLYNSEQKMGTIAQLSSLITLLISCLGLFGLASYSSKQKTKEIGIRKVSGASVSSIVWIISKEFLKWVAIAFIIACPVAWYIMNRWLQNFAYRVGIEWWMFVATGVVALAIAFFTVSYQVIKAARTNPVNSLRYE